jgi:hypothetical protein
MNNVISAAALKHVPSPSLHGVQNSAKYERCMLSHMVKTARNATQTGVGKVGRAWRSVTSPCAMVDNLQSYDLTYTGLDYGLST